MVRRGVGLEGDGSWDAAIVNHWGYWSHFDHESEQSSWPVIAAASADDLNEFGLLKGVLRDEPEAGDIFLQHSPMHRGFVRAGVLARVVARGAVDEERRYFDVLTIEGNTGAAGQPGGEQTLRVERRLSPERGDCFLRWMDLDDGAGAVDPTAPADTLIRRAA